jgi:hypothetical protein
MLRALVATLSVGALFAAAPATAPAMPPTCDPADPDCTVDPGPGVQHTLTIHVAGSGTAQPGTRTACTVSGGTNASTKTCTYGIAEGTSVTISQSAGGGSGFVGWSGACTGSVCTITMDADKAVTATFRDTTPPTPPTIHSPGNGQVIQSTTGGGTVVTFSGAGVDTVGYRCEVEGVDRGACTSGFATGNLATGNRRVRVFARDINGNEAPATRDFKVVNLPDTTLAGTPEAGALVASTAYAFTYSSTVAGASFECTLGGTIMPCTAGLPAGQGFQTLSVRAGVSPFGDNVTYYDPTPATRSWRVDSVGPETTLSSGPAAQTRETVAAFAFAGADPEPGTGVSSFECSLDATGFAPCTSGIAYAGLGAGDHTFAVRARDAAGNVDPSPTVHTWTVVEPAAESGGGTGPGPGPGPASKIAGSLKAVVRGGVTRIVRATIAGAPAGAKLQLRCRGKGCTFRTRTVAIANGRANATKLLRKAKLRRGAVLEMRLSVPGAATRIWRVTSRAPSKARTQTLCLKPGAKAPGTCA